MEIRLDNVLVVTRARMFVKGAHGEVVQVLYDDDSLHHAERGGWLAGARQIAPALEAGYVGVVMDGDANTHAYHGRVSYHGPAGELRRGEIKAPWRRLERLLREHVAALRGEVLR